MTAPAPKTVLQRYLQAAREALVWKLEGLSEYDARRPMTRTGTNLLGLVKHVASVEAGYLGDCFGRPSPESLPWFAEDAEPNADMWAMPEESREGIIDLLPPRVGALGRDDRGARARRAWSGAVVARGASPGDAAAGSRTHSH